jgi:hypothetical protein
MRKRSRIQSLSLCVSGFAIAGVARQAHAITVNGTLDPAFGSPLATQTIQTGFGTPTLYQGDESSGSELDAAYGTIQNNTLYLFFAGDYQNNGNHLDIFIADQRAGGQNTLNTTYGPTSAMNGSVFSPGFNATYVIDVNDYGGTLYSNAVDLTDGAGGYDGSIPLSSGVGSGTLTSGITYGLNNTNTVSIGENAGTAASPSIANSVTTGLEVGIPLGLLGDSTTVNVMADINGGNDGYLSNQFLPGLPLNTGNLTTSTFNLSGTANAYFTVSAPTPNGIWNNTGGGSWGVAGNWSNSYVPGVAGDSASFTSATSTSTITLDGSRTVSSVEFNSPTYSYEIAQGTGGGSLTLSANGATQPVIDNFAGTHTISAPMIFSGNVAVSCATSADTLTLSGNISGVGSLTVTGAGGYGPNVIISGNNSWQGGTTVTAGNLQLGSSTALPTGTALTLGATDVPAGVLDLNGNNATVSSITVTTGPQTVPTMSTAQIINTSANAAITATLTYAGSNANPSTLNNCNITDNSGSGGSTTALTVASGSLTLEGTDAYGGTTTVANGAYLAFSSATSAGTTFPSGGNVVNDGTMVLNDAVTAGTISGSGTTTVTAGQYVGVFGTLSQAGGVDNEGNLTVYNGGTIGGIRETGTAGALAIYGGMLQLAPNSAPSSQSVLYIASGAVLDITNNKLFIDYGTGPDPIASIEQWIANGYYGLPGPQIISSSIASADAATNLLYGIGYADGADNEVAGLPSGEIEIMFTLLGDANLDGTVNGEDFSQFSHNLGQSGLYWDDGDFNYDGTINSEDFSSFSHNLGQTASLASQTAGVLEEAANGINLTNVPEPVSAGIMVMTGLGILSRRRRSSHDCR